MPLFKGRAEKHALALAMTGVKLGDRLLQVGCTDASLGRIVVVERAPRSGLGALLRAGEPPDPHYQSSGGAIAALKAEGFKAVRELAERDGLSFFEGTA